MIFLRKKQVARTVGYHPATVMRKALDPDDDFPSPVYLGEKGAKNCPVAFVEDEITAWQERRLGDRKCNGSVETPPE